MALMCFVVILNISLLSLVISGKQVEWWDATEYLLKAKSMAIGTPSTGWAAHREIIPALVWYPFFKLGIGEQGAHVVMMLVGILGAYLAYLCGKEIMNENVGLITGLMMSTFYLYMFYTNRLTMYIVAPVLFMASIYMFWQYHKHGKIRGLYASFLIIGIGITIYYNTAFALLIIGLFMVSVNRKFYRNKHIWLAGMLTILVLSPYFIYSYYTFGSPLPRLTETARAAAAEGGGSLFKSLTAYPSLIPGMLKLPWLILLVVGLIASYKFFFGLDLVLTGKLNDEQPTLLLAYWIIVPLVMYSWTVASLAGGMVVMPEYIMIIFPALFMLIARGILDVYSRIKPYSKLAASLFVAISLIIGCGYQLYAGYAMVGGRLSSYSELREAAEFITANTAPSEYIATASVPQMVYYSERDVVGISTEETVNQFDANIRAHVPRFLLWSRYEPHPDWIIGYIQANNWSTVHVWGDQNNPTAVLLYHPWTSQ